MQGTSTQIGATLLAAVLSALPASAALDPSCEAWRQLPSSERQAHVRSALAALEPEGAAATPTARCLAAAQGAVAREVDHACHAGAPLDEAFRESALAWRFTCELVQARERRGLRTEPLERREIRAYWDACRDEGEPAACMRDGRERFVEAEAEAEAGPRDPVCSDFLAQNEVLRRAETEGRIAGRAALMPEVAACMQERGEEIAGDVARLCKSGLRGGDAWERVLSRHTHRCTSRGPAAF